MKYLPRELKKFDVFLEALPSPDRLIFLYCVCLVMCETGQLQRRNTVPGEDWSMVFFETKAGYRFHVIQLPLDSAIEAELVKDLRSVIEEYERLCSDKKPKKRPHRPIAEE